MADTGPIRTTLPNSRGFCLFYPKNSRDFGRGSACGRPAGFAPSTGFTIPIRRSGKAVRPGTDSRQTVFPSRRQPVSQPRTARPATPPLPDSPSGADISGGQAVLAPEENRCPDSPLSPIRGAREKPSPARCDGPFRSYQIRHPPRPDQAAAQPPNGRRRSSALPPHPPAGSQTSGPGSLARGRPSQPDSLSCTFISFRQHGYSKEEIPLPSPRSHAPLTIRAGFSRPLRRGHSALPDLPSVPIVSVRLCCFRPAGSSHPFPPSHLPAGFRSGVSGALRTDRPVSPDSPSRSVDSMRLCHFRPEGADQPSPPSHLPAGIRSGVFRMLRTGRAASPDSPSASADSVRLCHFRPEGADQPSPPSHLPVAVRSGVFRMLRTGRAASPDSPSRSADSIRLCSFRPEDVSHFPALTPARGCPLRRLQSASNRQSRATRFAIHIRRFHQTGRFTGRGSSQPCPPSHLPADVRAVVFGTLRTGRAAPPDSPSGSTNTIEPDSLQAEGSGQPSPRSRLPAGAQTGSPGSLCRSDSHSQIHHPD